MNEKPCLTCPIVENSCECNASKCGAWKQWWLKKWDEIHRYGEWIEKK